MHFCGNIWHDFIYALIALPFIGPMVWKVKLFFHRRKELSKSVPQEIREETRQ